MTGDGGQAAPRDASRRIQSRDVDLALAVVDLALAVVDLALAVVDLVVEFQELQVPVLRIPLDFLGLLAR